MGGQCKGGVATPRKPALAQGRALLARGWKDLEYSIINKDSLVHRGWRGISACTLTTAGQTVMWKQRQSCRWAQWSLWTNKGPVMRMYPVTHRAKGPLEDSASAHGEGGGATQGVLSLERAEPRLCARSGWLRMMT